MDGNPEGTPNPLNPGPSMASAADEPKLDTDTAAGTGSTALHEPVKPASFAQDAEHAEPITTADMPEMSAPEPESAMPEIPHAKPAPRPNHGVIDPMMRPVSRAHQNDSTLNRSESNFDTLGMDDVLIDELSEHPEPTPATEPTPVAEPNLVAKDSIVESTGKKGKKALIIGAIVLIMVAIICGAAAIAIAMLGSNDRVGRAIDKLINGQVSSIVAARGNITSLTGSGSDSTSTTIDFNGTFDLATSTNKLTAEVNADLATGGDISFTVNELKNKKGDVFLKLSGLTDLLGGLKAPITVDYTGESAINCVGAEGANCSSATTSTTYGLISVYSGLLETIDDQWILVSDDFEDSMEDLEILENNSTCLIKALGTLPKYTSDITAKYKANPFITHSTDKLEIAKRKNDLYRLGFNEDKMTAFVNSLSNNGFVNELNACAGNTATNSTTALSTIKEIFKNFPTVYAEVDNNDNFTRFYFKATTVVDDVTTTTTADLDLSYPTKLEIEEPEDYATMSTLLSSVMSGILSGSTDPTTSN